MSAIQTQDLLQAVAKLREEAVNKLITSLGHEFSMQLRGEIRAYDEIVYELIEKPRLEAERQALNGVDDD